MQFIVQFVEMPSGSSTYVMTVVSKKRSLLAFIDSYRSLPELWNTACVSYTNRVKKAAAYDILIEKLKPLEPDATRDSVARKINNIRSVFRKELKKVNESKKSGANDVYVPSLWYFEELMFLVGQETPHDGDSTNELANNNNENSVASSSPSTSSVPTPTDNAFAQPSRKRTSGPPSHDLLPKATWYLEADDDEFLILARSYVVKLRKLTQQQLMFADKVINETLLDGQMGLLTRGSYVVHPSGPLSTPSSSLDWSSNSYARNSEL